MVAFRAVQPLWRHDARRHDAEVDGESVGELGGHLGRTGPAMQTHDRNDRGRGGARRERWATDRAQSLRDLGQDEARRGSIGGEHLVECVTRHLENGRVAPGSDPGRPLLAGQQRQLAEHVAWAELTQRPAADVNLETAASHHERRPGRVPFAHQPGPGRHLEKLGGVLEPAACVGR